MAVDPDSSRIPNAGAPFEDVLKSALLLEVAHRVALVGRLLQSLPAEEAAKFAPHATAQGNVLGRPEGQSGPPRFRADQQSGVNWQDLGARFYAARDILSGESYTKSAKAQVLMLDLMKAFTAVGREHGVSLGVAGAMPETYLRLLVPFLAGSRVPLDEKQTAEIEGLQREAMRDWMRSKDIDTDRTELGEIQVLLSLSLQVGGKCAAVLTEDQRKESAVLHPVLPRLHAMHSKWKSSGTREHVKRDLTTFWLRDLALEESHRRLLEPIVHEYMAGVEALPMDEETRFTTLLDLMVLIQRRIRSSITMNEAQARRLNSWHEWYDFSIQESAEAGPPT